MAQGKLNPETEFVLKQFKLTAPALLGPVAGKPAGSANTLLYDMYGYYKVAIPKDIAGGMLCAILSDTVIYKSATTTAQDKAAGEALAKIAGVRDVKALGIEMFKIKSAIDGTPAR